MPATVVTSAPSGNVLIGAIDSGSHWSGAITINRVDYGNGAELQQFASGLPSPYLTYGQGVSDAIWSTLTRGLGVDQRYANISWTATDALDANYLVSDFYRPDNANVAGVSGEPGRASVIAFNIGTWNSYTPQIQQWIMLHELGHVLGLHHVTGLPAELDFAPYTVMSYNWYQLGDLNAGDGLPLTPMALDVALLQAKYGAAAANMGATTYSLASFGSDTDASDGFAQVGRAYACVWDAGGADAITCNASLGALINLNTATLQTGPLTGDLADVIGDVAGLSRIFATLSAQTRDEIVNPLKSAGGFFSSLLAGGSRAPGGYTIANGAQIETGAGGSGADLIIGNAFANTLTGGDGDDDLFGGSGEDRFEGGAGNDMIFGGLGNDSIVDSGGGSDFLRGDEGDDSILGGDAFDDIHGNMGSDTCSGGEGDDWVVGGKDNDLLFGNTGGDLVYGNLGDDTCVGGDGADVLRGGQANDVLDAGAGNDFVSGDRGDDTVTGGSGADNFHTFGDAGLDRVTDFNFAEGDRVQLDPGTQFTVSQVGADTVINMTGGGQMVLVGVQMSTLGGDWIFGA